MKIFLYDEKHEQVHAEVALGELSVEQIEVLRKVIEFCDIHTLTNRYRRLVVAESFKKDIIPDEDGDFDDYEQIIFNNQVA